MAGEREPGRFVDLSQRVARQFRPYANAATSHLTVRRSRFAGDPAVQLESLGWSKRFVTTDPTVRPFDAGAYHLALALRAATTAELPHAVVPDRNQVAYRLILREEHAAAFWFELVEQESDTATYATWTGDWGPVTRLVAECRPDVLAQQGFVLLHRFLRTPYRGVAPPEEAGCAVEHWRPAGDPAAGRPVWQAPRANPLHTTVLWDSDRMAELDVPTLGTVPTLQAFRDDQVPLQPRTPIDAVYLWVDDDDPAWRARRDAALVARGRPPAAGAVSAARFRQHDELRYSMRSLDYFVPWVRRVFLVTDGQRPDWLVDDDTVVTVVDHRDILEPDHAPVFNSHALCARLHHIPGLADNYLYVNDDVFFAAPVLPSQWFTPSGQPMFHNTRSTLPDPALLATLPTHDNARYNALRLVEQVSGYRPTRLFMHAPIAQSRPWQAELERRFADEYARTAGSRFRSAQDLEPIWLHHYLGYAEGRTVPGSLMYDYFGLSDPTLPQRLAAMSDYRWPQVFALNDEGVTAGANVAAMMQFLEDFFPVPSRFERDPAA